MINKNANGLVLYYSNTMNFTGHKINSFKSNIFRLNLSKKCLSMNKKQKVALLFPGQGFQFVGMLNEFILPKNENYQGIINDFDEIIKNETCSIPLSSSDLDIPNNYNGIKLSSLMTIEEGDSEDTLKYKRSILNDTKIAQPAILLQSYLNYQKFLSSKQFANSEYEIESMFGPSLGEILALVCAGSINYKTAARLLYKRGQFMGESCSQGQGAMLNVIGDIQLIQDKFIQFLETLADNERDYINISSINSKRLVVLSGKTLLIEKAMKFLKENSIACKRLPVSAAFHSKLMLQASEEFNKYLNDENNQIKFVRPNFKIYTTVDLAENDTLKNVYNYFNSNSQRENKDLPTDENNVNKFNTDVKSLLVKQLTRPVDLVACVKNNIESSTEIYDMNKRKIIPITEFI